MEGKRLKKIDLTSTAAAVTWAINQRTDKHLTVNVSKRDDGWAVWLITYTPSYQSQDVKAGMTMTEAHWFLTGMLYQQQEVFNKHA